DGDESIVGKKNASDFTSDGTGARADFKDSGRAPRLGQLANQGACKKTAAGQDRSGGVKIASKLAQKLRTVREKAHRRAASSGVCHWAGLGKGARSITARWALKVKRQIQKVRSAPPATERAVSRWKPENRRG